MRRVDRAISSEDRVRIAPTAQDVRNGPTCTQRPHLYIPRGWRPSSLATPQTAQVEPVPQAWHGSGRRLLHGV